MALHMKLQLHLTEKSHCCHLLWVGDISETFRPGYMYEVQFFHAQRILSLIY